MSNRLETNTEISLGSVRIDCRKCHKTFDVPVVREIGSHLTICGIKRSYQAAPNVACPHCRTPVNQVHNVLPRHFVK